MSQLLLRFFRWFCHPTLRNSIEGDLVELYNERVIKHGASVAKLFLAIDVIFLFRPSIIRPVKPYNGTYMFRNYFTIGWRNLLRNKGYSAINIGGLAAGMAVTIMIGMWIYDELSYNKSFENYDRIGHVMVYGGDGRTYPSNPVPLEAELRTNFSHDIQRVAIVTWPFDLSIASNGRKFLVQAVFMQPTGAEIFSLNMIYGTRKALTEPSTLVISESLSVKLFGNTDPVGQTVRLKNLVDLRVGGVYKDFGANTDLKDINIIGSWDYLLSWMTWMKGNRDNWSNNSQKIFVQLQEGKTFDEVTEKIQDLKKPHLDAERLKSNPQIFIHPMSRWHLYSTFQNRKIVTSEQLEFVWLYGIIGAFVLVLACINFMNLSTARSEKRSKEVAIRKTMGSLRQQLIVQFMSESFITVSIATLLSVIIVLIALPYFNDIAAKHILFPWANLLFWLALIGFAFVAGLMAGSYPALYLSSFNPVRVLKERMNSVPRKILIVAQFTVSIALIVGTIVVYQQIEFARNRPVGYTREGLIRVFMISPDLYQHYDVIRNELIRSGYAENVAKSSAPTTDVWSSYGGITWEGLPPGDERKPENNFSMNWVMGPYGETVGWKFIEGRDFSDAIKSDTTAIVVNRTAVKFMGMKDPIGKIVEKRYHIVGVIEDMLMGSPYQPVMPTIFQYRDDNMYTINIRLSPSLGTQDAIAGIASIFQKYNPSVPFDFGFVDDEYDKKFASEVRVGKLALVFSVLAILISLLGLFGMSAFVAERRTKEIGIRKVVGASIADLWGMLTKNFVVLVSFSCVISFPIAYYFLSMWLTKFEYRVDVSLWIFVVVAIGAMGIALATVSYQALRAALANPVDSLKSE